MTEVATMQKPPASASLVTRFAGRYGVDAGKLLATLKATAFKTEKPATDEQMMALLVVADQHGLNPFTREIFAFPDKGGIVPVVGVDGWARIINEHPQFDGLEFEFAEDASWCICTIYRKDREHRIQVQEFMSECKRGTGPWNSHPRRMLRHKTLIQCARLAFGFAGIYDPDEAAAIRHGGQVIDGEVIEASAPVTGIAAVKAAAKAKRGEKTDPQTGEIVGSATELDDEQISVALLVDQVNAAADKEAAAIVMDEAARVLAPASLPALQAAFEARWPA